MMLTLQPWKGKTILEAGGLFISRLLEPSKLGQVCWQVLRFITCGVPKQPPDPRSGPQEAARRRRPDGHGGAREVEPREFGCSDLVEAARVRTEDRVKHEWNIGEWLKDSISNSKGVV